MKHLLITLILVLTVVPVFAQDGAKKDKDSAPDKVELTTEQTRQVTDAQKDAQLASLQVENLTLKIQQAQEELKKLQESAQDKQKKLTALFVSLTKIPVEQLQNYTLEDKDGKLTLTKKATP